MFQPYITELLYEKYSADDCELAQQPCINGMCIDGKNAWKCECAAGWQGPTCSGEHSINLSLHDTKKGDSTIF